MDGFEEATPKAITPRSPERARRAGTSQSCGIVIATDRRFETITHISETVGDVFEKPAGDLLGLPTEDLLSKEQVHHIRNKLGYDTVGAQREPVLDLHLNSQRWENSLHVRGDTVILELIPFTKPETHPDALTFLRNLFNDASRDSAEVLDSATHHLRAWTRMDRVVGIQIDSDKSGRIVAEACRSNLRRKLGQIVEAPNIPTRADLSATHSQTSMVSDARSVGSAILALPDAPDLDMSMAVLRDPETDKRQHSAESQFRATLTIPILVDDVRWGLFSCQHGQPRLFSTSLLMAAELAGKFIGDRLAHAAAHSDTT